MHLNYKLLLQHKAFSVSPCKIPTQNLKIKQKRRWAQSHMWPPRKDTWRCGGDMNKRKRIPGETPGGTWWPLLPCHRLQHNKNNNINFDLKTDTTPSKQNKSWGRETPAAWDKTHTYCGHTHARKTLREAWEWENIYVTCEREETVSKGVENKKKQLKHITANESVSAQPPLICLNNLEHKLWL